MLYQSQYNHTCQLETNKGEYVWVLSNLLFGASAIINETIYKAFTEGEKNGRLSEEVLPEDTLRYFLDRKFIWSDPESEEEMVQLLSKTYGQRDQIAAGIQGGYYGFITSLYCNLACPYCFQQNKADSCGFLQPKQVDIGLETIASCEERVMSLTNGEKTLPKISITGGEPLLRSKANLEVLDYLLNRLSALHWPFSVTTNGTELAQFVATHEPMDNCRNVQVTLDGPREIHDIRRCFRDGKSSFDCIVEGVSVALSAGWKITLRVNLDMSNVYYLPKLAEFVQQRGWCEFDNFFAYVSPVTDHGNLGTYDRPKDEADLLLALLNVVEKAPYLRDVFDIRHFRGFNYVERILLYKDPRYPVIHRCEAVMGMYIFDPRGDVHVCLEAVGDPSLRIGTYDPEWNLDEIAEARWTQRHVLNLEQCSICKIRFICAGGCTMESFNNENTARCMPFLREMDIAWQYYVKKQPELLA